MGINLGKQFHSERVKWSFRRNQRLWVYFLFRILYPLKKFFYISNSTVFPMLVRKLRGLKPSNAKISITLCYTPPEMYSRPFVLDFRHYLYEISGGIADLDLINIYTVGKRYSPFHLRQDSYFLDPFSKFKDSWFGVFVLKNDDEGRGRRFILIDPLDDPSDFNNFNPNGIEFLMAYDQKIICFNSHMNYENLTEHEVWKLFCSKFYFKQNKDFGAKVINRKTENWLLFDRHYDTISALTDRRKTRMRQRDGIAAYIGLPETHSYKFVQPWHQITLTGKCIIRYFHELSSWLIVYYNGVKFKMNNNNEIDTNISSDIQLQYETMFQSMEIEFN